MELKIEGKWADSKDKWEVVEEFKMIWELKKEEIGKMVKEKLNENIGQQGK